MQKMSYFLRILWHDTFCSIYLHKSRVCNITFQWCGHFSEIWIQYIRHFAIWFCQFLFELRWGDGGAYYEDIYFNLLQFSSRSWCIYVILKKLHPFSSFLPSYIFSRIFPLNDFFLGGGSGSEYAHGWRAASRLIRSCWSGPVSYNRIGLT